MSEHYKPQSTDRRNFVVSAGLMLGAVCIPGVTRARAELKKKQVAEPSSQFHSAMRDIVGTAEPAEDLISLTLPDNFDNGHAVPFSISVDSEMSDQSYIKTIHMLASANPVAIVASFHLTPLSGAAIVSGRFRLAKSQVVHVLAQRNDGTLFSAKQLVNVKVGGCS